MDELSLLKTVIDESPIAMALFIGNQLTIHIANKAILTLWDKPQCVIGQSYQQVVSSFYDLQLTQEITNVYKSGISYEYAEYLLQKTDNNQLPFCYSITFKALKNDEGVTWGVLHTIKDITKRLHEKQELKLQESAIKNSSQFKSLFDQAPVAIGILSGWDMIVESANDSLLKLWGKGPEIIGLPLLTALPEIVNQPYLSLLREVYLTGQPYYGYEMLANLYHNNALNAAYFNFVFKPFKDEDEAINKIIVVANEVTHQVIDKIKLEESEQRFKSLIVEAPTATALYMGKKFVIDIANETMIKIWGKTESVIGVELEKALPELDGQPFIALLENVYATGISYEAKEMMANLVVDDKLQAYYFNFIYKPLFDTKGKVYGILNTAMDVTNQVLAKKELEELSRKKDEFLSVASHELKTPLTSLKASIQILNKLYKKNREDEAIPVFMHKANNNLVKILNLIDDLMNLSKIEQGQMLLRKTWFKIYNLVNECCDHIRTQKTHNLYLEGDEELEIYADRARIDQVLVNLINNAVKYAPNSKIIKIRIEDLGNGTRISVQDFGIGISPEKQFHLFDRYYRVDTSGIQFSGLGLGLYISAEIIQRHHGKIGVNSTVGQGSTFWFIIPK